MNDPTNVNFVKSVLRTTYLNNIQYLQWYDIHRGNCKRGPNTIIKQMKMYKPYRHEGIRGNINNQGRSMIFVSERIATRFMLSGEFSEHNYVIDSFPRYTFRDILYNIFTLTQVNLDNPEPVIYKDIEYKDEYILQQREKRPREQMSTESNKRFRDGYDDNTAINCEVFERSIPSIDIFTYFHIANKPGSNTEATKCTVLGRNYQNYRKNTIQTSSLAKERTRQFLCGFNKLCKLANQDFLWILNSWFAKRPKDFLNFLKEFISTNGSNLKLVSAEIQNTRRSGRFIVGLPKADFLSYVRCKCNLSYQTLQEFRLWTFTDDVIANEGLLKTETMRWNDTVTRTFGITAYRSGFISDPDQVIKFLIKSHNKEQNTRRELGLPHSKPVNRVKLKVCMDGRKIGDTKSVVFSVVPLNLSTFRRIDSCFPIAEWIGKETEAESYLGRVQAYFETACTTGITVDGIHYNLQVFWTSDLCSLQHVTNLRKGGLFCPYCSCHADPDSVFSVTGCPERNGSTALGHLLYIPHGRIIVCVLHMVQRITEYLLIRTSADVFQSEIEKRLQKLNNFSKFTFNDCDDKDHRDYLKKPKIYLSGRQCRTLITNFKKVLNDTDPIRWTDPTNGKVNELDTDVIDIWTSWKRIYRWITLAVLEFEEKKDELDDLQEDINTFMTSIIRKWSHSRKTSYYFIEDRSNGRSTTKENEEESNFYNQMLGIRINLSDVEWKVWQERYQILQVFLYHHRLLLQSVDIKEANWNRIPRRTSKKQGLLQ